MKPFLFLVIAICTLASCSGWDEESKKSFHQSCIDGAVREGMDEAAAKSMCDCRLEKVMKKYPTVEEALEHMVEITEDPEIKACK